MTDDLPRAEYDGPGWVSQLVLALGALTLAVFFLISPTRTGLGRWAIPAAWVIFAAFHLWRSLRLRREALARYAVRRRWQATSPHFRSPTDHEDAR